VLVFLIEIAARYPDIGRLCNFQTAVNDRLLCFSSDGRGQIDLLQCADRAESSGRQLNLLARLQGE
jgi:hypothetical protein